MIPATSFPQESNLLLWLLSLRGRDKRSREGGDTPKKVGGTAGLPLDASSSSSSPSQLNLPPRRQPGCPAPLDTKHLHAPENPSSSQQTAKIPDPTPGKAQLNLCSCVSILIRWHLGVHLLDYHTTQCTCWQSRPRSSVRLGGYWFNLLCPFLAQQELGIGAVPGKDRLPPLMHRGREWYLAVLQ